MDITLLGKLGEKFGRNWELDVLTPGEAVRAICCQCDGFAEYLNRGKFEVFLSVHSVHSVHALSKANPTKGCDDGLKVSPSSVHPQSILSPSSFDYGLKVSPSSFDYGLTFSPSSPEWIDERVDGVVICPAIEGSGAVGRIVTGAALLGASFFMPAAFLGVTSASVGQMGMAMFAGGVVELLTPPSGGSRESFLASAKGLNSVVQGNQIPTLCGERFLEPAIVYSWVDNNALQVDFVV